MNKLVLVDGNSIAYRAFFALPLLNNEKGIYTNAVYGFTNMLFKIIEDEKPTHLLVAFDAGKTTFRHETYKEYKGGREKTPPELSEQMPFIHEVLDQMGIKRYQKENYEADDIIGTLSRQAGGNGWQVKIVTGDKDLLQLVDDSVIVSLTRKGISDVEDYDRDKVYERYEMDPKKIIDLKGLMGDSSDNIPGVPGVGEKTGIKLLKQFASLEAIYDDIGEVSGKKLKEKLESHKEQAEMSKKLATINLDAPLGDLKIDETSYEHEITDKVAELFKELEFNSLLERIGYEASIDEQSKDIKVDFDILNELNEEHLTDRAALMVEVLEPNYHFADIIGFAIANKNGQFFIETEKALASEAFQQWLEDPDKKKILFDTKRADAVLKWRGIYLKGSAFDGEKLSFVLHSLDEGHLSYHWRKFCPSQPR